MESLFQILQFAHAPGVLMLLAIIRVLAALHYRSSVQSSTVLNFLCISSMHALTVAIWQCYFANSATSIKCFVQCWKFFTLKQQILSLFLLVPAIVCAPYFVTDGLLAFAHGAPPNTGMRVFNFIPAVLWTIPVVFNSALGLFQAAGGAQLRRMNQMHQVEEVFMVYLVSMILYCVFLKSSEEDTLVGSSGVTTVGILGVALVGFVFQYMYMRSHGLHERHNENTGQGQLAVDPSREPRASSAVESEEHSTTTAELALATTRPTSTEHRPMTSPSDNLLGVTCREYAVICNVQAPLLRFRTMVDYCIQVAQFVHHVPSFLVLLSIIRAVVAVHLSSVQSSTVINFFCINIMHGLTVVICQCYFANSVTSIRCFLQYWWEFFTLKQRILSLSLSVLVIMCAPLFVIIRLLEFAHGIPPSEAMCAVSLLPAILWTIPVVLYSALGLFQVARGAQLGQTHQMEEVFAVHLVNALLYCVFLKGSEGNNLVGSSDINVTTFIVFGVAFVGFVLQFLYMCSQGLRSGDVREERATPPSHLPLRVPHPNEEMVVHSERPVPLRQIPNAVCRCSADIHRFVAVL